MDNKKIEEISKKMASRCEMLSQDKDFKRALQPTNDKWNDKNRAFNQFTVIGPIMKAFRMEGDVKLKECWEFIALYMKLGKEREKHLSKNLKSAVYRLDNPNDPEVKAERYQVGRSYEYLQELAAEFQKVANLPNQEVALDFVFYRMFYQTYIGKVAEDKMRDYLNRLLEGSGARACWAPDKYDAKYSVDLIIEKDEKVVLGVQVKPESYLYAIAKAQKDQTNLNTTHNLDFKKRTNCDTIYIFYDAKYNPTLKKRDLNLLRKVKNAKSPK